MNGNWEIDATLIASWVGSLDESSRSQLYAGLQILQALGPATGRPLVDTVRHSKFSNMKELRPGSSGRSEIRVLFAFDPERRAILLLGGNKVGKWSKWYRQAIKIADRRYEDHLNNLKKGERDANSR